jgi:hypothetical protein
MDYDDESRSLGWLGELGVDDSGEGQIAERAVPVPALVPRLGHEAPGLGLRIEVGQRAKPRDAPGAVPGAPAAVGVLEVVGERARVVVGEAERPDLVERGQAAGETRGSGLTMPTPCSRFVAATASARAMIACETSASGSADTMGSPSSA